MDSFTMEVSALVEKLYPDQRAITSSANHMRSREASNRR